MPVDAKLRTLDIDIPSQPEPLMRLSLLMAEDQTNMTALSALIESDMALASAVLKAVNSSLYGLSGRVQTVQQAITFLGTREVAGIVLEIGLRAVFPPTVELVRVVVPDVAARRSPSIPEPATVTRSNVGAALDDGAVTRPDPPESLISTSVMEGRPASRKIPALALLENVEFETANVEPGA